ncbi:MAG: HAD family phosphatase [Gemmiger sp.]|nr:HAD family phosphatase [Gemmiger sp.]
MTNLRYAIMDMDGTLIDSTGMWEGVSAAVLARFGKTFPPEDAARTVTLTVEGTADFFVREYHLPATPAAVATLLRQAAGEGYAHQVVARPGVVAALDALAGAGVKLCVASGTEKPLIDAALTHLGLRDKFRFTICCQNPEGKAAPDVYFTAMAMLGAGAPGEVAVFEDSRRAIQTARAAGFYTVGVLDAYQKADWPTIRHTAHEICADWQSWAEAYRRTPAL